MRIGQGIDVHRFSDDPIRVLVIGLVEIPGSKGLAGHSDADVATHALCDALLGDITIIAEQPKLAAFMASMSEALSKVVGCVISVKATTTEGLGAIGRAEGIAASAVVLIEEK